MTSLEERVARVLARIDGGKITGPSRHKASDAYGWDANRDYMDKYVEAKWQKFTNDASAVIPIVAEAIAAIVDKWADANGQMTEFDDEGRIRENAAEEIAAAIRSMGERAE